jgi:hypothetical protein
MWVEAIVLQHDLSAVVGQLLPFTVPLGQDGELHVSDPSSVGLLAGVGARIVCKARLRWTVLGIGVPVTVDKLALTVRPEIAQTSAGGRLAFRLQIDHADVKGLPNMIDDGVTDLVNRELAAKRNELSWDYTSTLTHAFDLPPSLRPLEQLALSVADARVKTTADALGLAIRFQASVRRRASTTVAAPPNSPPAPVGGVPAGVPLSDSPPAHRRWGWTWLGGTLAAASLCAAYALGRAR